MKRKFFALLAGLCLVTSMTGCHGTLDGRSRSGVPFVKDTFVSRYERPADQVFAAAKEVLRFNGTLTGENTVIHTLEAKIDTNTVAVRVTEVEPNVTEVVVQSRKKSGFANLDLAREIDKRIALQLQAR